MFSRVLFLIFLLTGFLASAARAEEPPQTTPVESASKVGSDGAAEASGGLEKTEKREKSDKKAKSKKGRKARREIKDAEGTEAPGRFEADTVIKSRYEHGGKPLEVDPD